MEKRVAIAGIAFAGAIPPNNTLAEREVLDDVADALFVLARKYSSQTSMSYENSASIHLP